MSAPVKKPKSDDGPVYIECVRCGRKGVQSINVIEGDRMRTMLSKCVWCYSLPGGYRGCFVRNK